MALLKSTLPSHRLLRSAKSGGKGVQEGAFVLNRAPFLPELASRDAKTAQSVTSRRAGCFILGHL